MILVTTTTKITRRPAGPCPAYRDFANRCLEWLARPPGDPQAD